MIRFGSNVNLPVGSVQHDKAKGRKDQVTSCVPGNDPSVPEHWQGCDKVVDGRRIQRPSFLYFYELAPL